MKKILDWLKNNETGQGTLEYALIIVIISVAFVAILGIVGNSLLTKYQTIGNTIP